MEKYPAETRAQLMEDETNIRTVLPYPGGGNLVTLGFPGLTFDVRGDAYVEVDRLERTLSAPELSACEILIVLVERQEVPEDAWSCLETATTKHGIRLVHLPIRDYEVPDQDFMETWDAMKVEITGILTRGSTIALSCHYGAGRSGTMAASMLIDQGHTLNEAVALIRSKFAESIESTKQLDWLRQIAQAG
ncbi:dual specificity protein phosphatase family protein [Labrenzia sp. CE80]|uniref:protein-tyrosine phosphatase family protein n=1 Tax=Labrenzia sp. CE80 TaxID=1788986 RepID=UPI00129A1FBE|nr:dual specificity protein phosphatase family protein [Labrenzia sp. CE80]